MPGPKAKYQGMTPVTSRRHEFTDEAAERRTELKVAAGPHRAALTVIVFTGYEWKTRTPTICECNLRMNSRVNRPNTNPPSVMRSTHDVGGLPINVYAHPSWPGFVGVLVCRWLHAPPRLRWSGAIAPRNRTCRQRRSARGVPRQAPASRLRDARQRLPPPTAPDQVDEPTGSRRRLLAAQHPTVAHHDQARRSRTRGALPYRTRICAMLRRSGNSNYAYRRTSGSARSLIRIEVTLVAIHNEPLSTIATSQYSVAGGGNLISLFNF